jgi:hypothetical protein
MSHETSIQLIARTHTHSKNCITVTKEYNVSKLDITQHTLLHTIIMAFFLSFHNCIVYSTKHRIDYTVEITADQN